MAKNTPAVSKDLLSHFDDEARKKLEAMLAGGEITPEHIQQIIKLTAAVPDYRDADEFDSLLEDAGEMDQDAFASWIGKIIEDEKDK